MTVTTSSAIRPLIERTYRVFDASGMVLLGYAHPLLTPVVYLSDERVTLGEFPGQTFHRDDTMLTLIAET